MTEVHSCSYFCDRPECVKAQRDELRSRLAQPEQRPVLQDIEQYRMQMAGISTAAIGYWKEGDDIHPDYDTVALRDVAKLYAKYDALYKAQPEQEPVHNVQSNGRHSPRHKGGSMISKGLTRWYPRSIAPVREGWYECAVSVTTNAPPFVYFMFWDGRGFRAQIPMVVRQWRGLTQKAAHGIKGEA